MAKVLKSFIDVPAGHHFPIQNLPYGIFSTGANGGRTVGVAIGDFVLDLAKLHDHKFFKGPLLSNSRVFHQVCYLTSKFRPCRRKLSLFFVLEGQISSLIPSSLGVVRNSGLILS